CVTAACIGLAILNPVSPSAAQEPNPSSEQSQALDSQHPVDPSINRAAFERAVADPRMQGFNPLSLFPAGVAALLLGLWTVILAIWNFVSSPARFTLDRLGEALNAFLHSPLVLLVALAIIAALVSLYVRSLRS